MPSYGSETAAIGCESWRRSSHEPSCELCARQQVRCGPATTPGDTLCVPGLGRCGQRSGAGVRDVWGELAWSLLCSLAEAVGK